MTTNEALTKQSFLSKVLLKSGDSELSKDLKVKVMKMRIEFGKVRKSFDADLQEFVKDLAPARFSELQQKPESERTAEETAELQSITNKINEDYNAYVISRGKDEVSVNTGSLTDDEFNELMEVNADNDVNINGTELNAADFLEILYSLFVEN